MTEEEIIYEVSFKQKIPRHVVEHAVKHFYKGLRYYITHPQETGEGILLHEVGMFRLHDKVLKERVEQYKREGLEELEEIHNDLLKQIK